ncbi:hypothetical protein [Flavobacterium crassostreae]|uniref:Beta-carotene 15,15'-monooxygenase n=1 Tax=Flavobacterium crassostreae TaxID=1763534 RepID=A0A1B9E5I4_9FLAO|nr:hypothetical protein [Flavobacterium crassostreae]OCB77222.1 hypothetical protein LPBF_04270 [Flavobacterium crassostreae]
MITSVFKKSTPLNFSLVVFLILGFFFIYQSQDWSWTNSAELLFEKAAILLVLFGSVFVTNFISYKNGVSKDSGYVVLFFFLFLIFFPSLLDNLSLLLSNFFILLALRRLISLQSLSASKEKIFDASLWIFVASLFHFWSIVYILLVFISIVFHVYRDYRNWILPFIAFFSTAVIFVMVSLVFKIDYLDYLYQNMQVDFDLYYFTNNYQNAALSIYATAILFFMISIIGSLSHRPLVLHTTYKKIIASLCIAIVVYLISPNKSNDLLVYTIAPMAMLATSHIELPQIKLKQEMVLVVLLLCSLFAFFFQL